MFVLKGIDKKYKTIIAILSVHTVLSIVIAGFFNAKQQRYEYSVNEKITERSNTSNGFQSAEGLEASAGFLGFGTEKPVLKFK